MTTATVSDTTIVGRQVEFMEGLELMSTEVAGPVTTHSQLLPEGDHSSVGGHGSLGSVSSSLMGVTLGYPSEHTDPHDSTIASTDEGQSIAGSAAMATSVATAGTRLHTTVTARQPPADTETAAATSPTHAQNEIRPTTLALCDGSNGVLQKLLNRLRCSLRGRLVFTSKQP